ncbi:MAG: CZB domain-containing protein [Candidatus Magnetoovum sp. WYHC-5]|nr:CZB domain-containing protein [Candidatus Magnetoovum sp. WYHC-5]
MIDITMARITHLDWLYTLELALQKKRIYINIMPYGKCELGKWLYDEALAKYKDIPEIDTLEKEHKFFHLAADRVVKWHNSTTVSAQAEAQALLDFEELQKRSKEIIFLLTTVEFKLIKFYEEVGNKKAKSNNILKKIIGLFD